MNDLSIYDDEKRNKLINRTIRRTLLSFRSFLWLFLGIIFALIFSDFWYIFLGLAMLRIAWRTYSKVNNPEYVRKIVAKEIDIEDTKEFELNQLPKELKRRFKHLRNLERNIKKEIVSAESYLEAKLLPVSITVEQIVLKAHQLCHRLGSIKSYLEKTSPRDINREVIDLKTKIHTTTNPHLLVEVKRSITIREDNLKQIYDLNLQAESIEMKIKNAIFALENTHTRVIRLKTENIHGASIGEDEISKDIDTLMEDMKRFEGTMNLLLQSSGEEIKEDEFYRNAFKETLDKDKEN